MAVQLFTVCENLVAAEWRKRTDEIHGGEAPRRIRPPRPHCGNGGTEYRRFGTSNGAIDVRRNASPNFLVGIVIDHGNTLRNLTVYTIVQGNYTNMNSIDTTTSFGLEGLTPGQRLEWLVREIVRLRKTDPPAPWFSIARVLAAACQAADREAGADQEAGQIFAAASKAAGLSPQLLKRYVGVLRRTGSIANGAHLPIESLLSTMFNLQEVAVRLCERSPSEGIESLRELASGRSHFGLSTFRQLLANAPAAAGSAERMRREIQGAKAWGRSVTERAITEARESLWGAGATVRPRPRLRYFGGSGLEVIGGDGSVVAGIDLMVPHPGENRDVLASRAATSLSLAPFFREFHLAFAPNAGDDAPERAEALLEWLGYSWIGVIVVDSEGRATVRRKAGGTPTPDLSGRYEALKRRFPGGRASRQRSNETPKSDGEDQKVPPHENPPRLGGLANARIG